ncbi:MAG: phosphoribosylglycinamide formyltransferase [Saprospiraceae bacterium]|nr:phosphoribosylglycinamide formyltransferase [Saprospiraceae bacterium]
MVQIAIFASGSGTNAEKIIQHFADVEDIGVALVVCNKAKAGVLDIAERWGIPSMLINRDFFYGSDQMVFELKQQGIDFLVLAGFLWMIPSYLVHAYDHKMLNIHPALLPKFGGKGMYGMHVHEAVKNAGEPQTGITIHYVNDQYDDGAVVFQASCPVEIQDTPESIRQKVQVLEHRHFPEVVETVIREKFKLPARYF